MSKTDFRLMNLRPGLLLPLTLLLVGCAGNPTSLTVTSLQNHQTYQPQFSTAYAGRSEQGDLDVVLVRDGAKAASAGGVRQLVHVRVLWKPMKGTKLDHPTATNATIDWYVYEPGTGGAGGAGTPSVVAYTGAGFVSVSTSNGLTTLNVRNATLSPAAREGGMVDPIGRARLEGTIVAKAGKTERVRELLAQAHSVITQANAARLAAERQASSRAPIEP